MLTKEMECHLINHKIGILVGFNTMKIWNMFIGNRNMEIIIRGEKDEEMHKIAGYTHGGHLVIPTWRADEGV